MGNDHGSVPVACTLGTGELAGRAAAWKAAAAGGCHLERGENTLRLTFPAGQGTAGRLRELTALESDCCSFATWTCQENAGQVVICITAGDPVAITALAAMFAPLSSPA